MNRRILALVAGLLIASASPGWGEVSAAGPDPIVLVSNTMTDGSVYSSPFSNDRAQEFATGNNPQGYTVTGVRLAFFLGNPDGDPVTYRVELWSLTAQGGTADEKLGTFENPETLTDHSDGGTYFAAPDGGFKLEPEHSYLVLFEILAHGTWNASIRTVGSDDEDLSGEYTWSIESGHRYRDAAQTGAGGTWTTHQHALWLRIEGHKDRLAPTASQLGASRSVSSLVYAGPSHRSSSPCGSTQPSLTGAEALSNVRLVCDARAREWVKVQFAVPGVDYALESDLQRGNRETNGCFGSQWYDPIRKTCHTYRPGYDPRN